MRFDMGRTRIAVGTLPPSGWLLVASRGAQTLTIAAASDLQAVLPAIAQNFEQADRRRDAADLRFVRELLLPDPERRAVRRVPVGGPRHTRNSSSAGGQAVADTLYEYASGRIVVVDPERCRDRPLRAGFETLTDPRVRRIAIANPEHAPYGRAAVAALRHETPLRRASSPSSCSAKTFRRPPNSCSRATPTSGSSRCRVALAPALKSAASTMEIPSSIHPPIQQAAVVAAQPRRISRRARDFLDFLKRPESLKLLADFGFAVNDATDGLDRDRAQRQARDDRRAASCSSSACRSRTG